MHVGDVMRPLPRPIEGTESVQVAAERMKREDSGCLIVGDENHVEGIVTDRDVSLRCVADGKWPSATPVRDIMSVGVIHCREHETIGDVVERMIHHGLLRLPVVDWQGRMVGMISARDSVRSVPMAKLARSKALKVRFFKEIPTSQGHVHHVPVQSIYVTATADVRRARDEAIGRFTSDHGVGDWKLLADGMEIEHSA